MSLSYARQVKDYCERFDVTLRDTSTCTEYEVTLTAPDDSILWSSESEIYMIRQARQKGSRKDKFWDLVGSELSTGTIYKSAVLGWNNYVEWNAPVKN